MRHVLSLTLLVAAAALPGCKARRANSSAQLRNTGAQAQEAGSGTVVIEFLNAQNRREGLCSGSLTNGAGGQNAAGQNANLMILTSAHCFVRLVPVGVIPGGGGGRMPTIEDHEVPDEIGFDTGLPPGRGGNRIIGNIELVKAGRIKVVQVTQDETGVRKKSIPITGYWVHPQYINMAGGQAGGSLKAENDLAIVSVPAAGWNGNIRPFSTAAVKRTDIFKVSGFGVTTPEKNDSGVLREGNATVDARSVEMFRSSVMDPAMGGGPDVVVAPGDSGGPALFFDNGVEAIAGVIMGYRRTANIAGQGPNGGQQQQQQQQRPNQQGGAAAEGDEVGAQQQGQQQQQQPPPAGQDPGVPGNPQQGGIPPGGGGGGGGNNLYYSFFVDVLSQANAGFVVNPMAGTPGPK